MAFTESVKLDAKKRSNFACAACGNPFVEVHHILPQAEGGPDTLDNACPLCARCHDLVGGNPEKRKQLREMRDHQWEQNEKKRLSPDIVIFNEKLDVIKMQFESSHQTQNEYFKNIQGLLIERNNSANVAISKADSVSSMIAATGYYNIPK